MSHLYVTNPFDAAPVGKVKLSSESEVDAALAIAEKTHRNNKKGLPKYERAAILKKAAEIMKGRANELALLIASSIWIKASVLFDLIDFKRDLSQLTARLGNAQDCL